MLLFQSCIPLNTSFQGIKRNRAFIEDDGRSVDTRVVNLLSYAFLALF
jgi:hypothetical protein